MCRDFVCKKAPGRPASHYALNPEWLGHPAYGLCWHSIVTKEPHGLSRSDGSGPTAFSWSLGGRKAWDVTVVCPLADSYFMRCRSRPWGWFSSRGCSCSKPEKYAQLTMYHIFSQSPSSHWDQTSPINASGFAFLTNWVASFLRNLAMTERLVCFSESLFWCCVLCCFTPRHFHEGRGGGVMTIPAWHFSLHSIFFLTWKWVPGSNNNNNN